MRITGNPVWQKQGAQTGGEAGQGITSDADIARRNGALGVGPKSIFAQESSSSDTECNPCYNSSLHPNNNWAAPGSTLARSASVRVPGNPVWQRQGAQSGGEAGMVVTNDADVARRNSALSVPNTSVFAETDSETECNPCPNSTVTGSNKNWAQIAPRAEAAVQTSLI